MTKPKKKIRAIKNLAPTGIVVKLTPAVQSKSFPRKFMIEVLDYRDRDSEDHFLNPVSLSEAKDLIESLQERIADADVFQRLRVKVSEIESYLDSLMQFNDDAKMLLNNGDLQGAIDELSNMDSDIKDLVECHIQTQN